jgi:hypothetical protein
LGGTGPPVALVARNELRCSGAPSIACTVVPNIEAADGLACRMCWLFVGGDDGVAGVLDDAAAALVRRIGRANIASPCATRGGQ